MLHRGEYLQKKADPRRTIERVAPDIGVDGLTVDVLEHQVRLPRRAHAGVEQLGDAGMLQAGQRRALAAEARLPRAGETREVEQLDRREPFEAAIRARRQPHRAHAALAERALQPVSAELRTREPGVGVAIEKAVA